jgi:hypothetical protein
MTMMYPVPGVVDPIVFATPVEVELEPIYESVPAITQPRSAEDLKCAAIMLEKLRRREDVVPDDSQPQSAGPYDSQRVIDAVIEKLLCVL